MTNPADVAYTVLDTLGVRERVIAPRAGDPGTGLLDRLAAALADRDDVMILDNCEHVIEAAAVLAGRVLAVARTRTAVVLPAAPLGRGPRAPGPAGLPGPHRPARLSCRTA